VRSHCSASARSFRKVGLAIQSGASSVGPSGTAGRRGPPGRLLKASWGAGALPIIGSEPHTGFEYSSRVASRKPPPEQESGLGPDAARARNRPFLQAARRAGSRKGRKNAGIAPIRRFRRCTGRLKNDTTGINNLQRPVHTWIVRPVQGKRRGPATLPVIQGLPFRHG
jgi:hypothetical protein